MMRQVVLLITVCCSIAVYCQTDEKVTQLEKTVSELARQVMLQQLFVEERIRSDAGSGIKQLRHNRDGTRSYFSETHTLKSVASIHDHANNIRTVGMGEFAAVLNGVEFRTRHNDYRLYKPSTTTNEYHATEEIPFPDVPPSVLKAGSVDKQIIEMREYFRAWSSQDTSIRDFRPYFKPVLCYLEGAWTTDTTNLDEPFDSDRHHIEASSWFDLQDKIRYTSMIGLKSNMENFAFLPTTIYNVTEDGTPRYAQWNYRILCHDITKPILLDRFKVADDLATRMAYGDTLDELKTTRAARFRLNGKDAPYKEEAFFTYGLLDEIMYEIPGKDNYKRTLREESFDLLASKADGSDKTLNAARYHRLFKISQKGAMGTTNRHRGFKDGNLFVALNKQPKIAPFSVTTCKKKDCKTYESRISYAIPLEIVFLTPLLKWNPYKLKYTEGDLSETVEANGRNGGLTKDKAWDGTHPKRYYRTPASFFGGKEIGSDAADTVKGVAGVLDPSKTVREVVATGTRIFLPNIVGIGVLRTRWPIMPIHGETSSVWTELEAVKEILLQQEKYGHLMYESKQGNPDTDTDKGTGTGTVRLEIATTTKSGVGEHGHTVPVPSSELSDLKNGIVKELPATSSLDNGHQHNILIAYNGKTKKFYMKKCNGATRCPDGHPRILIGGI